MKVSNAKILSELKKGLTPAQLAKAIGISKAALSFRIRKLREIGVIKKSNYWPYFYQVLTPEETLDLTAPMGYRGVKLTVADSRRILETHKQGEWFKILSGRVSGGKVWTLAGGAKVHCFKEKDFTIKAFSSKLVIYAKSWWGLGPAAQIVDARTRIRVKADTFAKAQGLVLDWSGYAERPEFATTQVGEGVTKELETGMGLKEAPFSVGGVTFKAGSSSHPGKVHLAFSSGWTPTQCKEYADRIHRVGVSNRVVEAPDRLDAQEAVLRATTEALERLDAQIKALRAEETRLGLKEVVLPLKERREVG